ncbi:relaxase domain-containing protein [Streptomyces sp. NPDC058240]|uniref:relaxase domain-containing protein n=1 Tax=Streptomyces sp. NPDC058240 TaxID=3346396 RepID=UPI0036E3BAEB
MMDIAKVTAGQMYRYYLREVVVGDGRRPSRTPLADAQEESGVPAGRWMGRGLAVLGLVAGGEATEAQLRNLFGEGGRHPHADLIEADRLAAGESPRDAWRAGALGRRVKVTGVDPLFRPHPTIYLSWALGDDGRGGGDPVRPWWHPPGPGPGPGPATWSPPSSATMRHGRECRCSAIT